jgi:hypothetical protein
MIGELLSGQPVVQWLVCQQQGEEYVIRAVEADDGGATEVRRDLESAEPDEHFRVYRWEATLREVSRTLRPGDARWHVVQFTLKRNNTERTRWAVLPIDETVVPSYENGFGDRGAADALCDLRHRLPEGYTARAVFVRGAMQFEVSCPEPDRRWIVSRPAEQVDWLIRDAENDAAGAEERARVKAEEESEAHAAAERERAELEWVRKHGPRITRAQQDFILTLRERLAGLGGSDTVEGPTDRAGIYQLTKVQASVYIEKLKAQVDKLERKQAEAMFAAKESAQDG